MSEPLVQMLSAYTEATRSLGRPPKDEAELRKFLPADADKLFVSPRDGQPYVIRWGVSINDPNLNPADPPLVVYEQQGKNGVRHAVTVMGLVQLTDDQFAKLKLK